MTSHCYSCFGSRLTMVNGQERNIKIKRRFLGSLQSFLPSILPYKHQEGAFSETHYRSV